LGAIILVPVYLLTGRIEPSRYALELYSGQDTLTGLRKRRALQDIPQTQFRRIQQQVDDRARQTSIDVCVTFGLGEAATHAGSLASLLE